MIRWCERASSSCTNFALRSWFVGGQERWLCKACFRMWEKFERPNEPQHGTQTTISSDGEQAA